MSTDQTDPPARRRPEPGSLEDMVLAGMIETFFEPRMIGWHLQSAPDGQGGYTQTPVPTMTQSPLSQMAEAMFGRYRGEILEQVWEHLDVDALAQQAAEKLGKHLVDKLTDLQPDYGGRRPVEERLTASAKQVRERALEIVAAELARRQLAALDSGSDAGDHTDPATPQE